MMFEMKKSIDEQMMTGLCHSEELLVRDRRISTIAPAFLDSFIRSS